MKMTSCLIYLLAAALCVQQVDALQCYSCDTPTIRSECTTQTNCSVNITFCKTVIYPVESGYPFETVETVTRSCAKICKKTNPEDLVTMYPNLCCSKDLCNNVGVSSEYEDSGSGPISISYLLLVSSLGLVWAIRMRRS